MKDQQGDSPGDTGQAEAWFAEWAARVEVGEEADFTDVLRAHPEHVEELEELHDDWELFAPILGRVVPGLVASDAGVAPLSGGDEDAAEIPSQELLDRLRLHVPNSGRYKFRAVVGRGGGGVVLRVWDSKLNRALAMKVVLGRGEARPDGDTPHIDGRTLTRFVDEARIASQLNHPGIVPVHELGADETGRAFFTMKLVKGEDLARIFERVRTGEGGWNQTRALGVLLRACEAMAFAHEKGVVHRDLKPANIMVGRHGEVYVMDWGLARVVGEEDHRDLRLRPAAGAGVSAVDSLRRTEREATPDSPLVTMDGAVVGTPAYMSPEQARGELEQVGPRSDVYALGALMYELVAGGPPFVPAGARVSPHTVLMRVMEGPPRKLTELAPRAPVELVAICEKAMQRDPKVRYADVHSLVEDLRAYLERRVVAAYESGPWAELRKWTARNKALACAIVSLVAVALVGGPWLAASTTRAREQERAAQLSVYTGRVRAAGEAERNGEIGNLGAHLDEAPSEYRGWEWHYLNARRDNSIGVLKANASGLAHCEYDATGNHIALASQDGEVSIWDAVRLEKVLDVQGLADPTTMALIGNGERLFLATVAGSFQLWDLHEGRVLRQGTAPQTGDVYWAVDKGGKRLVSWSHSGATLWDLHGGAVLTELPMDPPARNLNDCAFDPSGRYFQVGSNEMVSIFEAVSGAPTAEIPIKGGERSIESIWSPSGDYLVSGSRENLMTVYAIPSGAAIHVFDETNVTISFSPDGAKAATADSIDSCTDNVAIWESSGWRHVTSAAVDCFQVDDMEFSLDGSKLLVWDLNEILVADSTDGAISHRLRAANRQWTHVNRAHITPDSRFVIGVFDNSAPQIWEAGSGAPAMTLTGHQSSISDSEISPSGHQMLARCFDGEVRLWWLAGPELITAQRAECHVSYAGLMPGGGPIWSKTGDPATLGDGMFSLWSSSSGESLATIPCGGDEGFQVALSPDGLLVAMAPWRGSVGLWDTSTGVLLWKTDFEVEDTWAQLEFSPDNRKVLVAVEDGGRATLLSVETGQPVFEFAGIPEYVSRCAFSLDGRWLAIAGGDGAFSPRGVTASMHGEVYLLDSRNGDVRVLSERDTGTVGAFEFNPDCATLTAFTYDGLARVWGLEKGVVIASWATGRRGQIQCCAFSPDGARHVTGSYLGWGFGLFGKGDSAHIWNASTGACVTTLLGRSDEVDSACWTRSASRLATRTEYSTRLWDTATGLELVLLDGGATSEFSDDEGRLVGIRGTNVLGYWDTKLKRERYAEFLTRLQQVPAARAALDQALSLTSGLVAAGRWLRGNTGLTPVVRSVALELLLKRCQQARLDSEELTILLTKRLWMGRLLGMETPADEEGAKSLVEVDPTLPTNPTGLDALAKDLLSDGDRTLETTMKALGLARRAVAVEGLEADERARYRNTLAVALFRMGKLDEALDQARKAAADDRNLVDSLQRMESEAATVRDDSGALRREELMQELQRVDARIRELKENPMVQAWRSANSR